MAQRSHRAPRITADRFFDLPDDGNRYELIDGELEMAPAPSADRHQHTVRELFRPLDFFVHTNRLGTVWFAPTDVILSAFDVVQPDIFFVSAERSSIIGGRIHGTPDLVVEVASPSTAEFDRGLKLRRYARFGVRWYWIVDPQMRTLDELELVNGAYVQRGRSEGDELFRPRLFPGLVIDLEEIWPLD